ncbi:TVP38/TMEM64 family protein [Legionella maioricensis]|uniref:TVP38/TMEM64 family membrane protein n=1 Tax=Legionella maioricensis TaxID=2896528 RepID=A0A9X2IAF2_9GAMM|nr:VTT domain-containing protein [Legionella maioricensis]MCL9683361.1 VTT domain-containing protein [Legionella maioricensis]MCL9685943.1 VTT domain-containing protein [Legionella maioricensis]
MTFSVLRRLWPLLLLAVLFFIFYSFHLNQYLTYSSLKLHHKQLTSWTDSHYIYAVVLFMTIYILCIVASIPVALFLTLTGGLFFGVLWGALYVVISATIGSTLIFLIIKFALSDWMTKRTAQWVKKMRRGFQHDAFAYLLVLRLIPLFPFWVVNIVPALLGIETKIFILATFLGIIPGSLIYAAIGGELNHLFDIGQTPDVKIIFSPQLFLPLLGLAFLSLLPIFYTKIKGSS